MGSLFVGSLFVGSLFVRIPLVLALVASNGRVDVCHMAEMRIGLLSCTPEYWGSVVIAEYLPE